MTITTATIEVTTTSLTRNIFRQLDPFRYPRSITRDNMKEKIRPVGRVDTDVLLETPEGVRKMPINDWFNNSSWEQTFGNVYQLPKIILLK